MGEITLIDMWNEMGNFAKGIVITLILMSIASLSVGVSKWIRFRQMSKATKAFAPSFAEALQQHRFREAIALVDEHPRSGRAFLPRVPERGFDDARDGEVEVGVGEDENRVLASHLRDQSARAAALGRAFCDARVQRGAGRVQVDRVPYVVDVALEKLKGVRHIVLAGAKFPVSFFAYPDKPSLLAPDGCGSTLLAGTEHDIEHALEYLAAEVGASGTPPLFVSKPARPELPAGRATPEGLGAVLGALMPDNAIVVDESVSVGRGLFPFTAGAPPHDWLNNMGGSIGFGLPCAVGAAIACPDRKVISLEGDGSGMYTLQSLWTMAREGLNVTVVVLANRSYAILKGEFANVGAGTPRQRATDMMSLERPNLDWVALARGHGVEAGRANDLEALAREFKRALAVQGPYLIELVMA